MLYVLPGDAVRLICKTPASVLRLLVRLFTFLYLDPATLILCNECRNISSRSLASMESILSFLQMRDGKWAHNALYMKCHQEQVHTTGC